MHLISILRPAVVASVPGTAENMRKPRRVHAFGKALVHGLARVPACAAHGPSSNCTQHQSDHSLHSRAPGCSMPIRLVPVRWSLHINGVFLGTPGGALASLTPIDTARTPAALRTGIAPRENPGTSLCKRAHTHKADDYHCTENEQNLTKLSLVGAVPGSW